MHFACATLSMSCPDVFHLISYTARFADKKIEHKMCVLIFSATFVWNIYDTRRTEQDGIINVCRSSCKVSDFNGTWIFGSDFRNILKYQISRRSVQWKSSVFTRTAVQTCRRLWSLFAVLQPRLKWFGRTFSCVLRGAISFIKFMYKKFMVLFVPC